MSLTTAFQTAVLNKDLLLIRIMLKDILLIDKSFKQFNEMIKYLEKEGINIWVENKDILVKEPEKDWTIDLLNIQLTILVDDFTKERVGYCQSIISKIYKTDSYYDYGQNSKQEYTVNQRDKNKSYAEKRKNKRKNNEDNEDNDKYYKKILDNIKIIDRIIEKNESSEGIIRWLYKDISKIKEAADNISYACDNINKNRRN